MIYETNICRLLKQIYGKNYNVKMIVLSRNGTEKIWAQTSGMVTLNLGGKFVQVSKETYCKLEDYLDPVCAAEQGEKDERYERPDPVHVCRPSSPMCKSKGEVELQGDL